MTLNDYIIITFIVKCDKKKAKKISTGKKKKGLRR